jgi:hypothetical protein
VAWPLLLYAALALAFWGPWVLGAPRSIILGANDIDPSAYLWFLSWWPHALLHGLNPLHTELIFAPEGYNLAWVPSMPGPSLLLLPVTLTLGPVVTWNLMSFAAPVLSAWTGFLLCRHVTGVLAPSLVGGYLFGFSPYMLNQLRGAPQLALVALLPILVLLVLRRVDGFLSDRWFVGAMTAVFTVQILISTEVLATAVVFGGLALVAGYFIAEERRVALRRTALLVGVALAVTVALTSPLLFYVLFREHTVPEQALVAYPADLLSFVVPGPLVAATPDRVGATAPDWATGAAYFGLPLLALVGAFAWAHRQSRAARVAVIAFLVTAVAALGEALHIAGDRTVPLPWAAFAELPLLRYAIPVRFSVFAFLAAGVIVSMWLAWRPSAARWGVVIIAIACLVPAVGDAAWHTRLSDVDFFDDGGGHAQLLDESDRVLTVPATGRNMHWHARADFSFEMAAGYVGAFPKSYARYPAWNALIFVQPGRRSAEVTSTSPEELRRFIVDKGVTAIVAERGLAGPLRRLFATLGVRPVATGGVLLYRLAPAAGGPRPRRAGGLAR